MDKKEEKMLSTEAEIKLWLRKMDIQDYRINSDLTVDAIGSVFLDRKNLTFLPIQFGTIGGNFYCHNNKLTTLKGSPNTVYGMFQCSNNELKSLQHAPQLVTEDFRCSDNPITSLEYSPQYVKGNFECEHCPIDSMLLFTSTVGKNFVHSWSFDNLDNAPLLFNFLKNFYKKDLLSQKMVMSLDKIYLEKIRLDTFINCPEKNNNMTIKKTVKL